jgi:hypothetical protein
MTSCCTRSAWIWVYGVLLKESRLLQRAVFVITRNDPCAYAEYVPDQWKEPDYTKALKAVRQSVGTSESDQEAEVNRMG